MSAAAAAIGTGPLTAEEALARMGQGRWELVRGEVREMAPAGAEHGGCAENLSFALGQHARAAGLGRVLAAETGFLIARDPDTVRAPDAAFIARDRLPERLPRGWLTVVPDLVAEVVSPSDRAEDVEEKVLDWLRAGVRLVWVVYPSVRRVHVHRPGSDVRVLEEGESLSGEEVLPGFSLRVGEIFE